HPLAGPVLRALERARFARLLACAARADGHLKARRVDPALRDLEQAFCLFTVRADTALAPQIVAHHTGLMSRLLTMIDDLPQGRPPPPGQPRPPARPAGRAPARAPPAPQPLAARRPSHPARARAPAERPGRPDRRSRAGGGRGAPGRPAGGRPVTSAVHFIII